MESSKPSISMTPSSILQSAYQVCKAVQGVSARVEFQSIFNDITFSKEDAPGRPSPDDRSTLGYGGRRQACQLLGFLLVEQERERLLNDPLPKFVPPFKDEERTLFREAHEQILAFNRLCVRDVVARLPNTDVSLNPYSRMLTLHPHTTSFSPDAGPLPFDALREAAEVFRAHPALQTILQQSWTSPFPASNVPPAKDIAMGVYKLEEELRQAGAFQMPADLQKEFETEPVQSPVRWLHRHVIALANVRASLRVFNQMIYQALRTDRLPVLNSDNIIEVPRNTSHMVGHGLEVHYQPDDKIDILIEWGDIVLMKQLSDEPSSSFAQDLLCEVAVPSFHFSNEWGTTGQLKMRVLDDHLCPYGNLYEHF